MNTYKLDREDLRQIIQIHLLGDYIFRQGYHPLPFLDKEIFNEVLASQPELESEVLKFKELLGPANKNHLLKLEKGVFEDVFENKIEVKSLTKILFDCHVSAPNARKKVALFKSLASKTTDFFILLEEKVKKDIGTASELFESYFKILAVRKDFDNALILPDIKKFLAFDTARQKLKLSFYLSLFKKDEKLYDIIMDDMGAQLKASPVLSNYWEEKLKSFPSEMTDQYKNKNEAISIFSAKQSYVYTLEINKNWLIGVRKLNEKEANLFVETFQLALSRFLNEKFEKENISTERNVKEVSFKCKSQEVCLEVQIVCEKLMNHLPSFLNGFDIKNPNVVPELKEKMSKSLFLYSLDESLPVKMDKNSRPKI